MKTKTFGILLTILVAAVLVATPVSAQCEPPCPPPPCLLPALSPGYWKHNVKVYCGGPGHYSGDPHETSATMESYEASIAINHPGFTLEWANEQFQDNTYKDMWLTIANWFNTASGRAQYSG